MGQRSKFFLHVIRPKNAGNGSKPKTSRLQSVVNAPAFVVLVGFFFTTLGGGLLTAAITDSHYAAQQRTERWKATEDAIRKQEDVIIAVMTDRLADARSVAGGMSDNSAPDEIATRWTQYQESYRAYQRQNQRSAVSLRAFAGSDLSAKALFSGYENNAFSLYKNLITKRFGAIDQCLIRAHNAYRARSVKGAAHDFESVDLDHCAGDGDKTPGARAPSIFALENGLSDCLINFELVLREIGKAKFDLGAALVADENRLFPRLSFSDGSSVPALRARVCEDYAAVRKRLETACGVIPQQDASEADFRLRC